jgi:hypothetical protein
MVHLPKHWPSSPRIVLFPHCAGNVVCEPPRSSCIQQALAMAAKPLIRNALVCVSPNGKRRVSSGPRNQTPSHAAGAACGADAGGYWAGLGVPLEHRAPVIGRL